MNAAHLHVMINHLPIIGIPLVALLVGWGLWRKSRDVLRLGLGLAVVLTAATYPVYLTGEPAEEIVEHAAWADEGRIELHEDRAKVALVVTLLAGAAALVALWTMRGDRPVRPVMPAVALAALLLSTASLGWTALAGGEIRHDEFRAGAPAVTDVETDDHETGGDR